MVCEPCGELVMVVDGEGTIAVDIKDLLSFNKPSELSTTPLVIDVRLAPGLLPLLLASFPSVLAKSKVNMPGRCIRADVAAVFPPADK